MYDRDDQKWLILRTSGRHTLPLAASLTAGGFEAWTPARKVQVRRGKAKVDAPLLPTFVFAGARSIADLLELADVPTKRQPDFSVFHFLDRIPLVADRELDALRHIERRDQPRPKARDYEPGDCVVPDDGAWAGMSGVVERRKGKFVMVLFPGWPLSVKIATFRLHPREMAA